MGQNLTCLLDYLDQHKGIKQLNSDFISYRNLQKSFNAKSVLSYSYQITYTASFEFCQTLLLRQRLFKELVFFSLFFSTMSGTITVPRFWGTPRIIIDEEQFADLEYTVEPRGLELLLYMVNGTSAVLHPLLQGQVGVGFVPALLAMYTGPWINLPTKILILHRCTVVYGLSLGCIVYRNPALFYRYVQMRFDLNNPDMLLTGYQARSEDDFVLDRSLGVDNSQIRPFSNVHSSPNSH